MNTVTTDIINRINLFKSHPLADIFEPNIVETNFGTYIYLDTYIKCKHNMIQDYADDFETIVIEHHRKQIHITLYLKIPTC